MPASVVALKAPTRFAPKLISQPPITSFTEWDRVGQIKSMLRQFEGGGFEAVAGLADAMFRDDRIHGTFATRVGALVGSDMKFKGANSKRKATKLAELIGGSDEQPGMWEQLCPSHAVVDFVVIARILGVAIAENVWDTSDPKHWRPTLRTWHPSTYRWDQQRGIYWLQAQGERIDLPSLEFGGRSDGQWVIWTPWGWRNPWRRSLLRPLAMPYIGRQWAYRDWARFNEKHGNPTEVIYAPDGAPPEEKQLVFDLFANRGSEATFTLPVGGPDDPKYSVELIEATSRSWESFKAIIDKYDADIAIAVKGQNLTTEVRAGSFAAAQVHEGVDLRIRREDAKVANVLQDQTLSHYVEKSIDDPALTPRVIYLVDDPDNELAEAQTIEAVGLGINACKLAGLPIDGEAVAVKFGIPLEPLEDTEDDETISVTPGKDVTLTPSAISAIITVNEARAAVGMGPLLGDNGEPDPDGDLTVAEFQQMHADVIADAAKAESGKKPGDPAPAPFGFGAGPPTDEPTDGRPPGRADDGTTVPPNERPTPPKRPDVELLARALVRLSARARRKAAGTRRAAGYAEALEKAGKRRAAEAMRANLETIMSDIALGGSLEDIRQRVIDRYKGGMSAAALRRVVEKTNIMAQLAGRKAVLEEV